MPAPDQTIDSQREEAVAEERTLLLPGRGPSARRALAPRSGREDAPSLAGTAIGRYRVKEMIGRGSFGEVYRAIDPRLGRDVAIKVADRRIAESPRLRELFWNEARIQARLEHSNIVPIYDLLEEAGRPMMVMRLIHGVDLDKRLQQMVRPFTPAESLRLMRQVSSALDVAHKRGVVHQDLKPANIRLTPSAEAVVLDFGMARVTGQSSAARPEAAGTPAYMAPEQICGEPADARSDIYAFAMTLYKTLTGHHPFEQARTLDELLQWQIAREPPPPTAYNPALPCALSDVVLQGLAKNPRERFRACADFTRAACRALGVPVDDDDAGRDRDGRWNPRAKVALAARVLLAADETASPARTVDLSTTGAALRCERALEAGCRAGLVIRIPLKNSEHLVRCSMRVMRVTPEPGSGTFRMGVVFEELGDFDRAVLADFVRAVLVLSGED